MDCQYLAVHPGVALGIYPNKDSPINNPLDAFSIIIHSPLRIAFYFQQAQVSEGISEIGKFL